MEIKEEWQILEKWDNDIREHDKSYMNKKWVAVDDVIRYCIEIEKRSGSITDLRLKLRKQD